MAEATETAEATEATIFPWARREEATRTTMMTIIDEKAKTATILHIVQIVIIHGHIHGNI